jgi:hypothetical protein
MSYFANRRAGLKRIYSDGYPERDRLLAAATSIQMIAISARGLLQVKDALINAICTRHAVVEILVLRPSSTFVSERERQEGLALRSGQIAEECRATKGRVAEIVTSCRAAGAKSGSIELRYYDTMPYCSLVLTDVGAVYVPYLIHDRSGSTPSLTIHAGSPLFNHLRRHFDTVWNTFGSSEEKEVFHP